MINSNDILARLQNGENAEAIANELINALNEANDIYTAEVAAKQKAEAAIAAKNQKKIADMQDILDLLHDFCIEYYCDGNEDINAVEEAFADLTAEKVIQMVEDAGEAVAQFEEQLKGIEKMFADNPFFPTKKPTVEVKVNKDAVPVSKADADFVIKSFLKTMGL